MKLKEIKDLREILSSTLSGIGADNPLPYLYINTERYNPEFNPEEINAAILAIAEYLLDQDIIYFAAPFEKETKKWNGSNQQIISLLKEFLNSLSPDELNEEPFLLYKFKYCFIPNKKDIDFDHWQPNLG